MRTDEVLSKLDLKGVKVLHLSPDLYDTIILKPADGSEPCFGGVPIRRTRGIAGVAYEYESPSLEKEARDLRTENANLRADRDKWHRNYGVAYKEIEYLRKQLNEVRRVVGLAGTAGPTLETP